MRRHAATLPATTRRRPAVVGSPGMATTGDWIPCRPCTDGPGRS
uniref:Uncharacterized protein n=1 Tax=uncultured bacterium A1Q1_fos_515 TaxID=1256581 RepID=L7VV27_9BACT|nr:hypothetical protein [uncultured bacterium A1Q1_fos_515]